MEFRDLKKQYQVLKPQIDEAVHQVMTNCNFISGQQVKDLETELAAYVGVKHCITCGNGTDALSLALMAWGVGKGDAVFIPDFTFFASGEVVAHCGATPVFIDVNPDTYNMDVNDLEQAIQQVKTNGKLIPKVVIPVDLFGLPADFSAIRAVCEKYALKILEDGAQGFGGRIGKQKACSFGDIATTSFFPAKPLGCYGDGGAIFTNDDEIDALLRSYAVHGKGTMKYDNVRIGVNSRLDTIQATVLSVKLKAFIEVELDAVNRVAARYEECLKGIVKTPIVPKNFLSSWAQYTVQFESRETRDAAQARLKANGIPSMIYYPKPMREQTAFQGLPHLDRACPVTERLCETVLSLPMHPYLRDDVEDICNLLRNK